MKCLKCKGKGKLIHRGTMTLHSYDCPDCKGTGRVEDTQDYVRVPRRSLEVVRDGFIEVAGWVDNPTTAEKLLAFAANVEELLQ